MSRADHKCLDLSWQNKAEMWHFTQQLAPLCKQGMVIYLHGNLGAGKTTFCQGLLAALGYQGAVKSPTYTLVEDYQLHELTIYHFDCYRLTSPEELEYIGIRDYDKKHAICLIEWPKMGEGWLPAPDLNCYIEVSAMASRQVRIVASSSRGENCLAKLSK